MSLINITYDDFDPPIIYTDPTQWTTPNPQDNPTWFNVSSDVSGSIWYEGTYHETIVKGASLSFNFTGSSLTIIGGTSSSSSNYTVTIDPSLPQPYTYAASAYAATANITRSVLYQSADLYYGKHQVVMTNQGTGMLLDEVIVGTVAGAAGATLTNTTLDNSSPDITFNGNWSTNFDPNFYGGSSIYTNTPGDNFTFSFTGSTLYIFGDQVNDHGLFSIYYNDSTVPVTTLSGRSGCEGTIGKYCEKLGGVHWADSGLPQGTHRVKLVNGGSGTYFDLDRIVYTTPSSYYTTPLVTNSTCPFKTCSTSTTSTSASGTQTGAAATTKASSGMRSLRIAGWRKGGLVVLALVLSCWVV